MAADFEKEGLDLSSKKSLCSASTDSLGKALEERLKGLRIKFNKLVRSLRAGLGGGTRRIMKVLKLRIENSRKRVPGLRQLRRLGFATDRIARTGGTARGHRVW